MIGIDHQVNPDTAIIGMTKERAAIMTSAIREALAPLQLVEGDGAPLLVVDLQPLSAVRRLSQFLGNRPHGHPVYQFDPIDTLSGDRRYMSVPELAAAYAEAALASGLGDGRIFLVGYRSAAALTLHIARLLADTRQVTTTLVRPAWPDTEMVRRQFADFQAALGAAFTGCPDLDDYPHQTVAEMARILREDVLAMAAKRGLDQSSAVLTELLTRYRAWLAFLLAGRNAGPVPWAAGLDLDVFTDTSGGRAVPGLGPRAYWTSRLPLLDHEPYSTPELAELIMARIGHRIDHRSA